MLLVNNLHWQASQRVKTNEILSACAICNFHSCYMKNALVFSQSDALCFLCRQVGWWTSEVPQVAMVSLVHFSWTSKLPLVVMIFLVHFSLFLLILYSKSALACLDGKFFEEVFSRNLWLCTHMSFTRFTIWTSFPHHFTTNQPKQKLLTFEKKALYGI